MVFEDSKISLALIRKAQGGSKESLSILTELVKDNLTAYLVRLTLNPHLSEDLFQETMLEMVKYLSEVKISSKRAFWGWLYKIALSKVCRQTRQKRQVSISHDLIESMTTDAEHTPPQKLMKKELTLTIYEAISSLKISYRNVIALRCFEQLSYAEIAGITGGTQIQAKLQFFRAKKALARRLKKKNFKESHPLPALGLFAALTAKSAKASSVSLSLNATTLEVGRITYILGTIISKVGLVVGACIVIALGNTVRQSDIGFSFNTSEPSDVLRHIMKDPNYAYPLSISQNYDSNGSGWQSVFYMGRRRRIEPVKPEEILIDDQTLPGKYLILPANYWIQAEFGDQIADDTGVDMFITGNRLTNKPQVSLVGPNEELQELVPTMIKDQPTGFTIIGFDLTTVDLSSKPSCVRVTATSSEASSRPFELRMIRTRLLQD